MANRENTEENERKKLESQLKKFRSLSSHAHEVAQAMEGIIYSLQNDHFIGQGVEQNEEYLKSSIGESFDINYRQFVIPALDNRKGLIVYLKGLVDVKEIEQYILSPLMECKQVPDVKGDTVSSGIMSMLMQASISISSVKKTGLMPEACNAIIEGNAVLFVEQCNNALIFSVQSRESRAIGEPTTESEVRAPREGFTEKLQTNTSLIRTRIKDHELRFEDFIIGRRTKTTVVLAYIKSLASESLLEEVRARLKRIKIDGLNGTGGLEELIEDNPFSLFPQIDATERPDKACAAILEGRVVILVDTTPFVLIIPTVFWNFLQSTGDYYERYFTGSFLRWIRFLAVFLSVSVSSFYVMTTSFHQEMIPTKLALKIAMGRSEVPFPALIEVLIMEVILEVIKEAGLRMPKAIGSSVTFVGSIVLGQAAVAAGLVGPPLIIVVAVAAICTFAIPSYGLANSLRLLRFPMLFLTAALGIFGYIGGLALIVLHLLSLRSFGEAFWAPIIPFDKSAVQDVVVRAPWWKMLRRPGLTYVEDTRRQVPGDLKPEPPKKG